MNCEDVPGVRHLVVVVVVVVVEVYLCEIVCVYTK